MIRRCIPLKNLTEVREKIPIKWRAYGKVLWKDFCFFPQTKYDHFLGHYFPRMGSDSLRPEKTVEYYFATNNHGLLFSELNMAYLDSIVHFAQIEEKKLILVNTPQHTSFSKILPREITEKYRQINDTYLAKGITVIDRQNLLFPDSLFKDVDHLNIDGAERFTQELADLLYHQ